MFCLHLMPLDKFKYLTLRITFLIFLLIKKIQFSKTIVNLTLCYVIETSKTFLVQVMYIQLS